MNVTSTGIRQEGPGRRTDHLRVIRALEELCDREEPGARIPTHTELMRRFDAPERAVLQALDELRRRGRIVRRRGSGTYVGSPTEVRPAVAAQVSDRSARTLVVIARPDQSFFDYCVSELYATADSRGYDVTYQLLRSQLDEPGNVRPILGSAAGFIVFGYTFAPVARMLLSEGNRVVVIGSPDIDEVPDVPCVCGDHDAGGYLTVRHLLDVGHRRIGFPVYRSVELRNPRWLGYRRALDEARRQGMVVTETRIDLPRLEAWEADPQTAASDLSGPDAPTALVAFNDFTAARILDTLRRAQVRVPEDVSVIGYDNVPIASTLTPPLTTIDSGVPQLLHAAIHILLAPRAAAPTTLQMTIPNLVLRGSVASPRS